MAYNRWVLTGLPDRAILLTNGDMDTYPVAVLQEVERLRPDVVLVNRGTLNESSYARYLREVKGVAMPLEDAALDGLAARRRADGTIELPGEQIIQGWVRMWREGTLDRPITFASTIDEPSIAVTPDPLRYCGAYTVVLKEFSDRPDVRTIERALSGFTPEDFFGPWVSDQDRSPVRRVGTKNIVRIVTNSALTLAEQAAIGGNRREFDRWLAYAKELESGTERGPVFADRIRQLEGKGIPPRP